MSQQRREERPRWLTLDVRSARMRTTSTQSRARDLNHDLALRALDVLCIFFAASSAPAALPVAATAAAIIGAVQLRHVQRVRRRARALLLLGALMSTRVLLLIIAARELSPSRAALAAATTPLLSAVSPAAPLLTVGALIALAHDASSTSSRGLFSITTPATLSVKGARERTDSDASLENGISEAKTRTLSKNDVPKSKGNQAIRGALSEPNAIDDVTAERPADDDAAADIRTADIKPDADSEKIVLDKGDIGVRQSQRNLESEANTEKIPLTADTSGSIRQIPAPFLLDSVNINPGLNTAVKDKGEAKKTHRKHSPHLSRHVLAVLSEKKPVKFAIEADPGAVHEEAEHVNESLLANGSQQELKKTARIVAQPNDVNPGTAAMKNIRAGRAAVDKARGFLWSVVCIALVVLASVLGEAANGISRALIAEIGNCSLVVFCASVASLLVQAPFLLLLASDFLPFVVTEDFQVTENVMTQGITIGLLSFVIPAFVLRRFEISKTTTQALSGSPTISSPSASSEFRAIVRLARVRLQAIVKLSVELCLVSLVLIPLLHLLTTWLFDYSDNISFLSFFAALLIFILSWFESRKIYKRADTDISNSWGLDSSSIFSPRNVMFALSQSVKQAFGIVHASSVNTVHVARIFIVQSQANKASWQVLNFFLLQAGMVLLESLYALTTKTSGLILVSADNIFCCVALALGLYAIRRGSSTRAQDAARLESLTGFANGVLLVYVAVLVVLEAVERHLERGSLEYAHTFSVCVLGVIGNLGGLVFFPPESRRENHNVQSIYLHIWGNTLAFVGVAAGAIKPTHPMVGIVGALVVGFIVAASAAPLLVRSARVLLRARAGSGPPRQLTTVAPVLRRLSGVRAVEEARAWMVGDVEVAVVRVVIASIGAHDNVLRSARECMATAGFPRMRAFIEVIGDDGVVAASGSVPGLARGVHRRAASSGPPDTLEIEGLYIQRGLRDGNA